MFNPQYCFISKTARYDEMTAFRKVAGIAFSRDDVIYLGDNPDNRCPDAYSSDYERGVEIVTCENSSFYLANKKYFVAIGRDNSLRKYFQDSSIIRLNTIPLKKQVFDPNDFVKDYTINYDEEERETYQRLHDITLSKFKKLNNGHYSKCKHVSLAIFSGYTPKPYISDEVVASIIHNVAKDFPVQFDVLLFISYDHVIRVYPKGQYLRLDGRTQETTIYSKADRANPSQIKKDDEFDF